MPSGASGPRFGLVAGTVLLGDLATKAAVVRSLADGAVHPVAGEWLQLRLVYNTGAAFGLHVGDLSRWIFLGIALVAVAVLARMAFRTPISDRLRWLALGLVAGGAAGNMLDRIRSSRGVIDFLDLGIGALRWPTFNLADIGVTCGAILLAVSFWLEDARRGRSRVSSALA